MRERKEGKRNEEIRLYADGYADGCADGCRSEWMFLIKRKHLKTRKQKKGNTDSGLSSKHQSCRFLCGEGKGFFKEEGLVVDIIEPERFDKCNTGCRKQGRIRCQLSEDVTYARTAEEPFTDSCNCDHHPA